MEARSQPDPGLAVLTTPALKLPSRIGKTVIVCWVAALAASVMLAVFTYGTNDVLFYEGYLRTIKTAGPVALYDLGGEVQAAGITAREPFWTPPFVINYLLTLDGISRVTGFPMRTCLKLLSSLALAIMPLFLFRLHPVETPAAILLVLAPASILIAGFHGSTDPMMMVLLTAAVYIAELKGRPGASGALYGLSCAIKLWPAVFLLCFALFFRNWRERFRFGICAAGCWVISGMPYLADRPAAIFKKILAYPSVDMGWGVRALTKLFSPGLDPLIGRYGSVVLFVLIGAVSVLLARRRCQLHVQVAFIAAFFLFLTPGFGYQYLIWIIPALIFVSARDLALWHLASGLYLASTYWHYMQPGWLANTLLPRRTMTEFILGFVVWALIGALLLPSVWEAARGNRPSLKARTAA